MRFALSIFSIATFSIGTLSLLGCKPVVNQAVTNIGIQSPLGDETPVASASATVDHRPGNPAAEGQIKLPRVPRVETTMSAPALPNLDNLPKIDPRRSNHHELTQPSPGQLSQMPHGVPPLPMGAGNPLEHRLPDMPGAPHGQPQQVPSPELQGIPRGVPDANLFRPQNIGLTGIPHGIAPIVPNLGVHAVQGLGTKDQPAWKELSKSAPPSPPATVKSAESKQ